ncbi:unnamed protein product (macronuclear) [Paramecium tetraurelia]|uniref:Uncharacterized protein n=1 Tax=Paramecium tetraurelia TaxID=5888 RepID=A0E916_PARTE|nr:uncharacterized protein GSPATT00024514001 [Paramecium tetraurelia]CAK91783.1 unnamed protein product [Paramecium tetraurelia]|eukprot:XP_001459180.1 hypothetical protein (macronuclear) [Paramecium tetraurelia strain d4-2]
MGCCKSFPNGCCASKSLENQTNSVILKENSEQFQNEFIQSVLNLDANCSVQKEKEINFPIKNTSYTKDITDVEIKQEYMKTSSKQWNIKQTMFVRVNSKKNINESYLIKEMIGQGGFGKVYKVVHKQTGMIRAVKMILKEKMKQEDEERLLEETAILMDIDHPNIVKLYEIFSDTYSYYLVSEYCEGGELFQKIKLVSILTEKEIANFMKQILSAVSYCHQKGIVHRDLKPENILFDQKHDQASIKIIDFGASAKLQNCEKLQKRIGTPFYVAPEVLDANYDEKSDIWSLGVILYILLSGYPPFMGTNEQEVLIKVKKGEYSFDPNDWGKVSNTGKDLIRRMLLYNPTNRISAADALNHEWIKNNKAKGQINNLTLSKLQDFDSKNKLKYAIFQFITVQVVTNQEKNDLLKIFQEIDKNGDGTVSKDELYQAYLKIHKGNKLAAETVVEELFPQLDANGSGIVDFSEFITATINKEKSLSRQRIEQSFKLFDLDGNGLITKQELNELFDEEIDEEMWQEILDQCDNDNDGMINLNEFINLLENKISKTPLFKS